MTTPSTTATDASARAIVMRHIAHQARRYPDLALERADTQGLSPRDAALGHAVEDATVRRWLTIAYLLDRRLARPLRTQRPAAQAALLTGGAQLLFFDRLPPYAVIDESVEWAKRACGRGAGGMVNAVLRRLNEMIARDGEAPLRRPVWSRRRDELPLPDGGALVLNEEFLPEDEIERLGVATGLPASLVECLRRLTSLRRAGEIAQHALVKPPVILNATHAHAPLPSDSVQPHAISGHLVFTGDHDQLASLLSSRTDIWAQDPTSSAAAGLARDLKPSLIVDVCAGQGTKTRQLRAMFPDASIVASDADDRRRAVLERIFAADDAVRVVTPERLINEAARADLVLLDVPCSNTGVLARRIEARLRYSDASVESVASVQRQILADSLRLLTPRGAVLYATCSLDPRENDDQIRWLSKWHGLKPTARELRLPEGGPGKPATISQDGGFAALSR